MDHQSNTRDRFTLEGDIFKGTNGEAIAAPLMTPPYFDHYNHENKEKGGNLLARWTRSLSGSSELSFQTYYDRSEHDLHLGSVKVDTVDAEFQHRFPLATCHDITWGCGYRLYKDDFSVNPELVSIHPSGRSVDIFNAFLQDEIRFFEKHLLLTLGSKFEYNDYTRFEFQPNARLLWKPDDIHSAWLSVARAVRTPSRVENDVSAIITVIPPPAMGPLPIALTFNGSNDFGSEKLTAYELGYRVQATSSLVFDASLYYDEYEGLRTTSTGVPVPGDFPPTYMILSSTCTNDTKGKVYGFELASEWYASHWVRFKPAYTYLENRIEYSPTDILSSQDPRHQLSLRTSLDLPRNVNCDVWFRHVSRLSATINSYDTIDARIGWKCTRNLEISVIGQNLLDSHHAEFQPEALHTVGTEMERGVYGKVVWTFD
jgi:iron complex outermembrane receptor protein